MGTKNNNNNSNNNNSSSHNAPEGVATSTPGIPKNGRKMDSASAVPTLSPTGGGKKRVSSPLPPSAAAFKLKFSLDDFTGSGFLYKGKLVGTESVGESKGNDMAQKTFGILRKRASAAKKHKPRVLVYLSLKGIRVVSEKTATLLVESPINKITFLTRDLACQRTYGIVVCVTDLQYRFVAIKAERSADVVVATIRELFDVAALAQKQRGGGTNKAATATMVLINERAIDVPPEQQQRLKDDINHELKYQVSSTASSSTTTQGQQKVKSFAESSSSNDLMMSSSSDEMKATRASSTASSGSKPNGNSTPQSSANDAAQGRPYSIATTAIAPTSGGRFKGAFSKLFASSKRGNSMVDIGQLDSATENANSPEDVAVSSENKKRGDSRLSVTSVESVKNSSSKALKSLRGKKPISKSTVDISASEQQTHSSEPDATKERVFQSSKKDRGRRSKSGSAKKASRSSRNSHDAAASNQEQPQKPSSPLGESAGMDENPFSTIHASSPNLDCLLEFDSSHISSGCNRESDLFDPFRKPSKGSSLDPNSSATDFDPFTSSTHDVIQQDYSLFGDSKVSTEDSAFGFDSSPWFAGAPQSSGPDSQFSKSMGSLDILESFGQSSAFGLENSTSAAMENELNGLDPFGCHVFGNDATENELISFDTLVAGDKKTSCLMRENGEDYYDDDDTAFGFKLTSEARDLTRESQRMPRRESTKRTLKSHSMSNLLDDVTFFYNADWAVPNGDDCFGANSASKEGFECFNDVIIVTEEIGDDYYDDKLVCGSGNKLAQQKPMHRSVANLDEKFSMRAASVISASYSMSNLSGVSQTYSDKPVLRTLQVLDKPFDDDPFFLS